MDILQGATNLDGHEGCTECHPDRPGEMKDDDGGDSSEEEEHVQSVRLEDSLDTTLFAVP